MKTLSCVLLLGCACAVVPSKEPRRSPRRYTIGQFMETTAAMGASFSPDEKSILFSSNPTGIFNAYTVSIDGGAATPVTRSTTESVFARAFFPHDGRILYVHDQGGNENNHLYVRELDGSERDLTPGDKVRAELYGFNHEGTAFYLGSNARDPKHLDIFKLDARSYAATELYRLEEDYQFGDISGDERYLAFSKTRTNNDTNLYLYDLTSKEMKLISEHQGDAEYRTQTFDPASRYFYYVTNDGSEFFRLARYELASGKREEVEKPKWDVEYIRFSKKGKYRITAVNEDAKIAIRLVEEATGKAVALPQLRGTVSSARFSDSESKLAFYLGSDVAQDDLHVIDLPTGRVTRLTNGLSKEIDPADLVESTVVRFHSFDGLEIPSVFYRPQDAAPDHKAPALVFVHGGPGGQTTRVYSSLLQFLANHGYVVLGINNRGSSGYGKTFYHADDKKHGREPLWDCVEAKTYLASLPYVDPERIGIIGGSYGGYMVLAALAFRPEAFKVGVDLFGVANWVRTLESIPAWWASFREALYSELGDPKADAEMLRAISPLFHADQIQMPLLVIQGANDPRVLKVESDEIVAAVKKKNVPVEYLVFPDEGHGFRKKKNQMESNQKILEFLDKYLARH